MYQTNIMCQTNYHRIKGNLQMLTKELCFAYKNTYGLQIMIKFLELIINIGHLVLDI